MCVSNPQVEWFTIWGYTHEEILHRWSIWKKFDIVTRIFGSGEKEKDEPKTPVNDEATFAALANLFGPNFMNTPAQETSNE
jgi:hypothetical protein